MCSSDLGIHRPRLFGADVGLDTEAFNLCCNLASEGRDVEFTDARNTRLSSQERRPGRLNRVAQGADTPQTSYNDAPARHRLVIGFKNDL